MVREGGNSKRWRGWCCVVRDGGCGRNDGGGECLRQWAMAVVVVVVSP
jgi:hypothetical protein